MIIWARSAQALLCTPFCAVREVGASIVTYCRGRWEPSDGEEIRWSVPEEQRCARCVLVLALAEIGTERDTRQAKIFAWSKVAFGVEQSTSLPQRGVRLLEEAIEAFQAAGGDPGIAHKLVDFVFARPVGALHQELGGVGVCLLALAAAAGLSADEEERRELARVLAKPIDEFTRRNAAKNAAGFLVTRSTRNDGEASS